MKDKLSEVQVIPVKTRDGFVGFASFVFDNCFYMGSIGIWTRPGGGFRLTYPTRKSETSSTAMYHPINKETSQAIEEAITSKLEEILLLGIGIYGRNKSETSDD